jgi:hypothetical protein
MVSSALRPDSSWLATYGLRRTGWRRTGCDVLPGILYVVVDGEFDEIAGRTRDADVEARRVIDERAERVRDKAFSERFDEGSHPVSSRHAAAGIQRGLVHLGRVRSEVIDRGTVRIVRLVGSDRNVDVAVELRLPVDAGVRDRLLEPLHLQLFGGSRQSKRFGEAVQRVRIHREAEPRRWRFRYRLDPLSILFDAAADGDLYRFESRFCEPRAVFDQLVRRFAVREHGVGSHVVRLPAEEFIKRLVGVLADDIPQRLVDGGERLERPGALGVLIEVVSTLNHIG